MNLDLDKIEIFKQMLATPKKVVILSHTNPDGDAIGSSLALAEVLKQRGHTVHCTTRMLFTRLFTIFVTMPLNSQELAENLLLISVRSRVKRSEFQFMIRGKLLTQRMPSAFLTASIRQIKAEDLIRVVSDLVFTSVRQLLMPTVKLFSTILTRTDVNFGLL